MLRLAASVLLLASLTATPTISVTPARLRIATGPCNGADLQVKIKNTTRTPSYASVKLAADGDLQMPRRLVQTWLPAGYSRTVPVSVSATTAGDYTVRVTSGGARREIPIHAAPPVRSKNLARTATRVTASSARAGLLACGALDGDADPAHWWKGTGWADATGREWPDWFRIGWDAPQRIGGVELVTVGSAEFPVGRFGLRDWDVQVGTDAGWQTVASVRGNRRTTVRSTFEPRRTTAMRIVTYAANGTNDWSRIVEISVHAEV